MGGFGGMAEEGRRPWLWGAATAKGEKGEETGSVLIIGTILGLDVVRI